MSRERKVSGKKEFKRWIDSINLLLRGSENSVDLLDMEILLAEEDPLDVAKVQDLLVMPGQESPAESLLSAEELFFDYPDIKLEEPDTISEDLEVSQLIEVYQDVLPSLGPEIEITHTVSSLQVDDI